MLVVSRENSCRYCYATVRAMMRMLGLDEGRVLAIEAELAGGQLDARREAVVQSARAQTLTRVHNCAILITAAVREELGPHVQLRALPPTAVKGIEERLAPFEVVARSRSVAEPTVTTPG